MDDGQRQGWAVVLYTSTGCEAWPEVRCASMVVAPCTLAEADQVMRAVPEGFAPHRVAVEDPAAFLAGEPPPPLRLGARRGPGDPTGDPPLVPEGDPAGDQAVLRSAPERDQPTVKGTMTMPYQTGWQRVRIYVPPRPGPGGPPDWGLPEGGAPGQGLPEYPDQGLPRPPWTRPGRPPDWGLPEGDQPGQGLPPGWGGGWRPGQPPDWGLEEGAPGQGLPGWPERPGHGLPWPGRPVYPVVDDPDDLGGHPEIPDLNMTHRILITDGSDQFTGYVLMFEPPQVEDDYEPRHPSRGLPGTWVTVLYGAHLAWAWVRTPGSPPEPPEHPEREPKM